MKETIIELVNKVLRNLPWGEISSHTASDVANYLIENDVVLVVRCKDCKHWHEETGWCTKHSHFIGFDGMACHPSQSSEWKMFDADYFCKDGEREDNVQREKI